MFLKRRKIAGDLALRVGSDEMLLERPVRFQRFPAERALNWWVVCHFHTFRRFEGNGYSMHMLVAHPAGRPLARDSAGKKVRYVAAHRLVAA